MSVIWLLCAAGFILAGWFIVGERSLDMRAVGLSVVGWLMLAAAVWFSQGYPSRLQPPQTAIYIAASGPYIWAVVNGEPRTYLAPEMAEKVRKAKAEHPEAPGFTSNGQHDASDVQGDLKVYNVPEMEK